MVRAIGPSLTSAGIANPLLNPTLEIHDGNGVLESSNDDWKDCQAAEIQATGLQPSNDHESTILAALRPGNYTAAKVTTLLLLPCVPRRGSLRLNGYESDKQSHVVNIHQFGLNL